MIQVPITATQVAQTAVSQRLRGLPGWCGAAKRRGLVAQSSKLLNHRWTLHGEGVVRSGRRRLCFT